MEDLDKLEELCYYIKDNSLCGSGPDSAEPGALHPAGISETSISRTLQDKNCPAGVCKALLNYIIDPDKCKGCTLCARNCPVGAITGSCQASRMSSIRRSASSAAPAWKSASSARSAKNKEGV